MITVVSLSLSLLSMSWGGLIYFCKTWTNDKTLPALASIMLPELHTISTPYKSPDLECNNRPLIDKRL